MQFGENPTFLYKENDPGTIITERKLKLIKQINLVNLIQTVKLFTENGLVNKKVIFLIEPSGSNYKIHQVGIVPPKKHTVVE